LAHRLGMNTVKWELEDLAFATLYPKRYEEIVRLVAERAPSRDTYLAGVIARVDEELKAGGIKALLTGRPKHYYSIYQKMIVRGGSSATSTTSSASASWSTRCATATRRSASSTRTGSRCPAGSRTTSRCRSSTCTSRCTPR
jgi:hypothetical protein